jgi:hypothetical protein
LRTALLVLDSATMMAAALIGAYFGELQGASIAVAMQRLFSGMVDFSFAVRVLGGRVTDIVKFACRAFVPFSLPAAGLVALNLSQPLLAPDIHSAVLSALRTLAAIGGFMLLAYAIDRQVIKEVFTLLGNLLLQKRAPAPPAKSDTANS